MALPTTLTSLAPPKTVTSVELRDTNGSCRSTKLPMVPRPICRARFSISGPTTDPGTARLSTVTVLPLSRISRTTRWTQPVPLGQSANGRQTELLPKPVPSLAEIAE